jgi:hypothetical protein
LEGSDEVTDEDRPSRTPIRPEPKTSLEFGDDYNPHSEVAIVILVVTVTIMIGVAIAAVWVYALRPCGCP